MKQKTQEMIKTRYETTKISSDQKDFLHFPERIRLAACLVRGERFFQFAKFLSVGVVNTLVGLLVIYSAKWFFNVGDVPANALGYAVGLSVSFTLNSRWTFAHRGPRLPALIKFLLVSLVAYGMNLLTVMVAIHYLGLNDYIAQALGVPPYTLTSFLASKYLVFRIKPELNEEFKHDNG